MRACLIVVLCALSSCGAADDAAESSPERLPTSSLEDGGLDRAYWDAALRDLEDRRLPIDAMLLVHRGAVVAEYYAPGHARRSLHDLRSATKSITSMLVGAATDRGMLDLQASVESFFPEQSAHPSWRDYQPMRVGDLLTMSSGLDCDDWAASPGNEERMYLSADWLDFFFAIPAKREPGERFSYCTSGVVTLGEIVSRVAGRSLPELAEAWLFEPLGITDAEWAEAPHGVTDSGGHLRLSVESLAKLGLLMHGGGVYAGKRLLSASYVEASLTPSTWIFSPDQGPQYGYLWWLEPVRDGVAHSYQARGNGGQYIIALPAFDALVVFTGHAYNQPPEISQAPFDLTQRFVVPMLEQPAR